VALCLLGNIFAPPAWAVAQALERDQRGSVLEIVTWRALAPDHVRGPDPDLEPGFPVQTFHAGGSYTGGPGIHTLVGNIDGDPELEIVVSGLGSGYLYAWNHDGTPLPGWPMTAYPGAPYPVLGQFSAATGALEAFTAHFGHPDYLAALDQFGVPLAGWPRQASNYISGPGSALDLDADGLSEVFTCEEDARVHAYTADGTVPLGWPVYYGPPGRQRCSTPALGDLDQDGVPEIITASGAELLVALRRDGTYAPGFPWLYTVGGPSLFDPFTYATLGDVDGDGILDIVVVGWNDLVKSVLIFTASGQVKRTMPLTGDVAYGSAPALGDLDDDGIPEIVVQTDNALNVFEGDGTTFPGWPQVWSLTGQGNGAPVIGDVTGDGQPDLVVVSAAPYDGEVRVFESSGTLDPRYAPKRLPLGLGAAPAIADIDLDGRNELLITSNFWSGFPGFYDKVWAFDLRGQSRYGAVHWGQYMAEASHRGVYPLGLTARGLTLDDAVGGDGNGILEPGERTVVATRWRNMGTFTRPLTGTITEFTGPSPGPGQYVLEDATADHGAVPEGATTDCVGAGGDCYAVAVGSVRPLLHWDAALGERLAGGPRREWRVHVGNSFADVARSSPFYRFVETLLHASVTAGCGATEYCPASSTAREQMAVFVLRAKERGGYAPPACAIPVFGDVPASSPFCGWIEELARRGVVTGCGGGNYCPAAPVTREQMAVFVLRTLDAALDPPACTAPVFGDVPASSPYCRWIEELARRGIVGGCGGGNYCPGEPVTREQMGVFISLTFGLSLYGA
jgi:hypothetical protein